MKTAESLAWQASYIDCVKDAERDLGDIGVRRLGVHGLQKLKELKQQRISCEKCGHVHYAIIIENSRK